MNFIAIRGLADVDGGWFHRWPSFRNVASCPRAAAPGRRTRKDASA